MGGRHADVLLALRHGNALLLRQTTRYLALSDGCLDSVYILDNIFISHDAVGFIQSGFLAHQCPPLRSEHFRNKSWLYLAKNCKIDWKPGCSLDGKLVEEFVGEPAYKISNKM